MGEQKQYPRTEEIARPDSVPCPYEDAYETDVLVVGCGFAGLNAAVSASEAGQRVLVVDKGRPGYSGLSPWPSSFRWFDPERGDDAESFREAMRRGGDYLSNLNWYECWIRESKGIYKRLTEWGILAQYPKAAEAGNYYQNEDFVGYHEFFEHFDRHKRWVEVLEKYGISFLEHTMIADLLVTEGKVAGAIGLHVPSGEIIRFRAKSVVMACGGGSYKPTGYPTGGDTFDGEYIAWNLGLPIMGKEFEDFHATSAQAPGNVFLDNHWQYLENIWLCGGDVTPEKAADYGATKGRIMVLGRVDKAVKGVPSADGSEIQDVAEASYTRRGGSRYYDTDPEEVRSGKMSTPVAASVLAGAATGMCCHLTSGVFTGLDDLEGKTEIAGLYVAGDGIHATSPSGAAYPCGVGFTSCFTSIDGDHAGKAAAGYASGLLAAPIVDETELKVKEAEIREPLFKKRGFDSNWARDVLHSIMAPYWVSTVKSEATLNAALVQVEYLRDHVIPNLAASSGHDLRLCLEMKHKVLSAELKLRASLARKESRGNTYREDYPFRDDENYLGYQLLAKDGEKIQISRVKLPNEWTGEADESYEKRYGYYFPGEAEKIGFEVPAAPDFGRGRREK